MRKALILVDIQNDFIDGSLAVPNAEKIIPVVNELLEKDWDLVVATKDWHPEDHKAFTVNNEGRADFEVVDGDVLWPSHCVAGTKGSDLHEDLHIEFIDEYVLKGTDSNVHPYSGFDVQPDMSELVEILDDSDIDTVYIVGLATDYCVKETAMDAEYLGFETYVITDGVAGLDKEDEALEEMQDNDIFLTTGGAVNG